MKKLLIFIKFFFRKRQKISSDFANNKIKDFAYTVVKDSISDYNTITSNNEETINYDFLHPLFFTKISWNIIQNLNDFLETKINSEILNTIVHQSEHIIIHLYKKDIQNLIVKSKITEITKHKKGTKIFIKFEYYSGNEHIATEFSSGIMFGVKLKGKDVKSGENFRSENFGNTILWTKPLNISENLPFEYAKKANIDAPIHTDSDFAKSIGLKGIVLQGTCTFAKSVSLIASSEIKNDFRKIKEVYARFTGLVYPNDNLNVRLFKKNNNTLYFDVINKKGNKIIKGGTIKTI